MRAYISSYINILNQAWHLNTLTHVIHSRQKIIRHQSNISFPRACKRLNLIPNGLRATNVLANTTNSLLAESLALKHSRQWLQLSLDTQYYQLSKI